MVLKIQKTLNFADMAKAILDKGIPLSYFVLLKAGDRNLYRAFREINKKTMSDFFYSDIGDFFGRIKAEYASSSFRENLRVNAVFVLYAMAKCNERNFLDYYEFFCVKCPKLTLSPWMGRWKSPMQITWPAKEKQFHKWLNDVSGFLEERKKTGGVQYGHSAKGIRILDKIAEKDMQPLIKEVFARLRKKKQLNSCWA